MELHVDFIAQHLGLAAIFGRQTPTGQKLPKPAPPKKNKLPTKYRVKKKKDLGCVDPGLAVYTGNCDT
jgi:hypothetical protein